MSTQHTAATPTEEHASTPVAFSITYPDNPKREARLQQLSSDAFNYLREATYAYEELKRISPLINEAIAAAYRKAGAEPPAVEPVDFSDEDIKDTVFEYSKLVSPMVALFVEWRVLNPAIVSWLVRSGRLELKVAQTVLPNVLGKVFGLTRGALRAAVIGGPLISVALIGLEVLLDVIQGATRRDSLIEGIRQYVPARGAAWLSMRQLTILNNSLSSVKASLDALTAVGITPSAEQINQLVSKSVQPFIDEAKGWTIQRAQAYLAQRDIAQGAYLADDLPEVARTTIDATFVLKHRSDFVADIDNGEKKNGTKIILWPAHRAANQQWQTDQSEGGSFVLKSKHSGKVMDVFNGDTVAGTSVVQWDSHNGPNQRWLAYPAGGSNDAVFLVSQLRPHEDGLLTLAAPGGRQGEQLSIQRLDGSDSQVWLLTK